MQWAKLLEQRTCNETVSSRALTPFHMIWTPMKRSRNEDSRMITGQATG